MTLRSQALPQQRFWAGKTVVVAGATGFLGGWLVRRLLEYDAKVVAIVREPNKQSQVFMDSLIDQTAFELGSVDDAASSNGFSKSTKSTLSSTAPTEPMSIECCVSRSSVSVRAR